MCECSCRKGLHLKQNDETFCFFTWMNFKTDAYLQSAVWTLYNCFLDKTEKSIFSLMDGVGKEKTTQTMQAIPRLAHNNALSYITPWSQGSSEHEARTSLWERQKDDLSQEKALPHILYTFSNTTNCSLYRVLMGAHSLEDATPLLFDLLFLLVHFQAQFKVLKIAFKVLGSKYKKIAGSCMPF